jgi:formate dehydrogenase maturation protein FdhE
MSEVGGPKLGLMNIGEEAKPRFAVLPDASSLFLTRSKRLAALAPKHELEPYLEFEPLAHPAASLGLDMLVAEEGWKRGGRNPFLLGY